MNRQEAHLLIVDDDERIRLLLQKFLIRSGFFVTAARDAEHARRILSGLEFDMIVIDVMMPGEDGLALTRSIRADNTVPILMLTAMAETEARIDGLEGGVDDYLCKPFEPRELVLRILTILRRARPALVAREIRLGEFVFDLERETLQGADGPVWLTASEAVCYRSWRKTPAKC